MHFALWVRSTRLEKGMTVTECAERAKVKQPVWTEWEGAAEDKEWRRATLQKIADGLQMPIERVAEAANANWKPIPQTEAGERLARRLDPILMRIPPSRRAKAEDMTEDYLRNLADFALV